MREKLLTDPQGYSSGRAYYFRAASTVQCMPFCFIQKKSNKSRCGISWRQDSTCLAHLLYVFEPFYGRALTALTLQEEKQEFKSTLTSLAEAARRRKEATTVFERTQYAVRQACVFASLSFIYNKPRLPHRCTKRLHSSPSWLLSSLWCAKRAACWWLWLLWSVACPYSRSSSAAFEPRMPKEKQLTVLVTVHSLHAADLPFSFRLSLLHFGAPCTISQSLAT